MISPENDIVSSYNRLIKTVDALGRRLTVRNINALDRLRLLKAAGPELAQNDAWLNMAALTLAVVEVNDVPRIAPVNERQIEAAISDLGDQGLEAIAAVLNENDDRNSIFSESPEGNL